MKLPMQEADRKRRVLAHEEQRGERLAARGVEDQQRAGGQPA